MLVAIALIALVGVAMGAAASVFRLDLRRTVAVVGDAQLRQLLVAGERAAREKLPAAPGAVAQSNGPVALPAVLAARGAALAVRLDVGQSGNEATATVEAALEGRVASQTLHYERGPAGWRLVSAALNPPV